MRRVLIVVVILLVIAGAAALVLTQRQAASAQSSTAARTATIGRQTLERSVTASGTLDPATQVNLSFGSSGRVTAVLVNTGDVVTTGETLARVETTTLALDLADAQTQLAQSQLALAKLQEPATASDIATAEANLASARAALADLLKPADPASVAIAQLGIDRARIQLWQTQLSTSTGQNLPDYQKQINQLRLDAAQEAVTQAEQSYAQAIAGPTSEELTSARAQVEQASISLQKLQTGPTQADLDQAQTQVREAELGVQAAQAKLDAATLVAPMNGVVVSVNVHAGENAGSGPAIVIADLSHFNLGVSVDEMDMTQFHKGQAVSVTLDALPNVDLAAQVTEVDTLPTDNNGTVTYGVQVALPQSSTQLYGGMSATLVAVLERRENVIAVPNWALRVDSTTGQTLVTVQRGQTLESVPVTLGLSGDEYSEVLSGLSEGDVVVQTATSQSTTNSPGGGGVFLPGPGGRAP